MTSAVALEVDHKWLDNLLSHHKVSGVRQARQGVSRTLPYSSLRILAITLELIAGVQSPLPQALSWAHRLDSGDNPAASGNLKVQIDLEKVDRWLDGRLAFAVEVAPTPRRGRPRRTE